MQRRKRQRRHNAKFSRAPVVGGHWRLRQLRQFDFGYQYEENDVLRVVIPLPGIGKDGLSVQAKERLLQVSATVREDLEKYATRPDDNWEIVLKEMVIPETAKATYTAGVLLVDIELADPGHELDTIEMEE